METKPFSNCGCFCFVNSGLPSIAILEESIKLGSNVILQKNKCNFCHFDKKYCYSCHVFAAHFCRRCRQPVFLNGLHQKIEYLFVIYRLPYFPAKVSGKNVTLDNRSNLIYVQ